MEKLKIIVDTDIGSDIDDALCLAYLLQQPDCELLGITTGSSEPEKRAELADSICRAVGREVPIYPGLKDPILGKQVQVAVHQYEVVQTMPHRTEFPENQAIDFMREMILKYPHEVVLLPIGPLTNIGALFAAYPELAPLVKEISLMGGSYFEYGQSYLPVEFNIKCDAVAAKIVFESGAKICAAGLDVSLKLKISCRDFLKNTTEPALLPVRPYAQKFLDRTDDMYFHDALSAALLFDRSICSFKRGEVHVSLGADWGRTWFAEKSGGTTEVACEVDVQRFFQHYYDVIRGAGGI